MATSPDISPTTSSITQTTTLYVYLFVKRQHCSPLTPCLYSLTSLFLLKQLLYRGNKTHLCNFLIVVIKREWHMLITQAFGIGEASQKGGQQTHFLVGLWHLPVTLTALRQSVTPAAPAAWMAVLYGGVHGSNNRLNLCSKNQHCWYTGSL